jgi:hypothetical protein
MRKIGLVLSALILLTAINCTGNTGGINLNAPEIPPNLCSEHDPAASFLLKVSAERGIALNEVYYGLLDGTQIAMIIEVADREKVKAFMEDVAKW